MTLYFYPRQIRAALRQVRSALALLARPASFHTGNYCVSDGLDAVYFDSLDAAMVWADWLSAQPDCKQCKVHVIDTTAPRGSGMIRELETGSPTWYRLNQLGEWELNLSDPEVADCYSDSGFCRD